MRKFNLIVFLILFFGFSQLFLVYKNFRLMNKINELENKRSLLIVKIKKEDIRLDSLSTFSYSLLSKNLKIVDSFSFSKEIASFSETLPLTEIAKKENGKK
ncbi:MAG: hypothetical protein ABIK56_00815 [candidate division WOR-3 bacterium]